MNELLRRDSSVLPEPARSTRRRSPRPLAEPFVGDLELGWAARASATIEAQVAYSSRSEHVSSRVINLLPGVHETWGAVSELKETLEAFGFGARVLPDCATGSPGRDDDARLCGTTVSEIYRVACSVRTLAIGDHMRQPARVLKAKTGVPVTVLPSVIGLEASDRLIALLSRLSGRAVPTRIAKQRAQLFEVMAETQAQVAGKRVGIVAEPDLLQAFVRLFERLGADVPIAVNCTSGAVPPARLPQLALSQKQLGAVTSLSREHDLDLLVGSSHVEPLAQALRIPLFLVGSPIQGRVGYQYRALGGYRGTRELVAEIREAFSACPRRRRAERRTESLVYLPRSSEAHRVGA